MPTMAGLRGERALVGLAAAAVTLVAILLIVVSHGVNPGETVGKVGLSGVIRGFYGFLAAAAGARAAPREP